MQRRLALLALVVLTLAAFPFTPLLSAADDVLPLPSGTLITVAGTGKPGSSGDDGPAREAQLNWPQVVAFDAAGNLFIADMQNHRVRKLDPHGTITNFAGTGKEGTKGDNGPAKQAQFYLPLVMADGLGNLLISDPNSHRVRKVSPDGIITKFAGTGVLGATGDGGLATAARMNGPGAMAVDAEGNVYISELTGNRVRKVTPEGIISTYVGGGKKSPVEAEGGLATEVRLNGPGGLAVDSAGNLFLTEFGQLSGTRVWRVSRDGTINRVAGNGTRGFSGDGGPAIEAQLNAPIAVTVDSAGNLFISDLGNHRIRKVTPEGTISTIVGSGVGAFAGEGGPATAATIWGPRGLAIDAVGNLFFADSGLVPPNPAGPNERVLKVVGAAAPGLVAGKPFPKP